MSIDAQIILTAVVAAVACAVVGVFLVLRRMALMSTAISHSVLLGIVLGYLALGNLSSPWMIAGAALAGLVTVTLVELLARSGRVREDAAIALVFPALFSIAVILIAGFADTRELNTRAVLLGNIEQVWLNSVTVFGVRLPWALVAMSAILLLDLAFIVAFFKELKLATFDAALATAFGFSPAILHYILMALVSVTAVGAFDAAGSVLVVALMIAPPATAMLVARRLWLVMLLSAGIGAVVAVAGYAVASALRVVSIAGCMAMMAGAIFALAMFFAPRQGLIARRIHDYRQRMAFARTMLVIHLFAHECRPGSMARCHPDHLHVFLQYDRPFLARVIRSAIRAGLVTQEPAGYLRLTDTGRHHADSTRHRA